MEEGSVLSAIMHAVNAGYAFVIEAYLDESGTHGGSPITCVAGYLFESEQSLRLEREWKSALGDFGIGHFHMADCAGGGGDFRGRSVSDRDALCRKLIGIIQRRALLGIVASVDPREYAKVAERTLVERGGAYMMSLLWCVQGVGQWAASREYRGRIAYFFEAGHRLQSHASSAMMRVKTNPGLERRLCYASHAFIDKNEACAIQAADLLAWQWYKDAIGNQSQPRRPRRLDLRSLLESPHYSCHLEGRDMEVMKEMVLRGASADAAESPE